MMITDERTGFPLFDSRYNPFKKEAPGQDAIKEALNGMILSASGWRGVFARNGIEESGDPEISQEGAYIYAAAALVHAAYLKAHFPHPSVLVGIDARPTGEKLGQCVVRAFLSEQIAVRYLFIASAPEIMAENLGGAHGCDAFFYISASHNPLGHNGIKFGGEGGVYPGSLTSQFASSFRQMLTDPLSIRNKMLSVHQTQMEEIFLQSGEAKEEALQTYRNFVLETGEKPLGQYREMMHRAPIGVVIDFNGSARADSIDTSLLKEMGVKLFTINSDCRKVAHGIVPEGENLSQCQKALEEAHKKDPSFILGYLPDNDGDRGNIVLWDEKRNKAVTPDAQEVFALVVMASLSEVRISHPEAKLAIAVNGPTSSRIDRIASAFSCDVFRSEVGEANVVSLGEKLRKQGYLVKILGEGSNGGNITYPAKVRDPMNTILTLFRLLGETEIFRLWCSRTGKTMPRQITLSTVMEMLPRFSTTGAFSPEGVMHTHLDPGTLKKRYEQIFQRSWKEKESFLHSHGIASYRIYQMEGTITREGIGPAYRTSPFNGGWKAALFDEGGREIGFLWMRPSGTEPLMRVMCDIEGEDGALHDSLLKWHRKMVEEADR